MKSKQLILLALMIASLTACGSDSEDPAPKDAPVLSAIGDKTVLQGSNLNFDITATDPNGDNLVFDAAATGANDPRAVNPPATLSTNQDLVSANFDWTPDTSILGDYPMKFTVTDDSAKTLSDSETIMITVVNRVGQGRILYRDNCSSCHGFEGQNGPSFIFAIGAASATAMMNAINSRTSTMGISANAFSADQLNMMNRYFCSLPANVDALECNQV